MNPLENEILLILNARPLRFMWLLVHYPIFCAYKGVRVRVPHPAAFGIHKLIVSTRRTKAPKMENDRQQAEAVLTALRDEKDFEVLKIIVSKLSKKEKKAVTQAAQGRPILEELLSKFLNGPR